MGELGELGELERGELIYIKLWEFSLVTSPPHNLITLLLMAFIRNLPLKLSTPYSLFTR
jgi:hypothetical protein